MLTRIRANEIAEKAIGYLIENDLYEDFIVEYSLEVYEEEVKYFRIPNYIKEWLEEEGYLEE